MQTLTSFDPASLSDLIENSIFGPIGVFLLIWGLFSLFRTLRFLRTALYAVGEVIELVTKRVGQGQGFAPRVQFTNEMGQTVVFTSSLASRPPSFSTGQQVRVFYTADYPEKAKIDGFWQLWFVPIFASFLGSIFVAVHILIFWQ